MYLGTSTLPSAVPLELGSHHSWSPVTGWGLSSSSSSRRMVFNLLGNEKRKKSSCLLKSLLCCCSTGWPTRFHRLCKARFLDTYVIRVRTRGDFKQKAILTFSHIFTHVRILQFKRLSFFFFFLLFLFSFFVMVKDVIAPWGIDKKTERQTDRQTDSSAPCCYIT